MPAVFLDDRAVIALEGAEARSLLQGLVTCDVGRVAPAQAAFGALLTPQGKILFDFFIVDDGARLLLDTPRALATDLAKRLNFYKLRAKVAISDISAQFGVFALLDGAAAPCPAAAYDDPRAPALGERAIAPPPTGGRLGDSVAYERARIAARIPQGGVDFEYGQVFPHDVNMDALGGVAFDKGCYVGQEVVSRMRHRGGVRRRIVRMHFSGAAPQPGAEIFAGENLIGTAGGAIDGEGLALVRIDRAAEARARGLAFSCNGARVALDPYDGATGDAS